jgi:hypothetical protein
MAICPKCEKQELQPGENLCPHCKNKKTNFFVKAGEVVLTVAVAAISFVVFKKPPSEK